VPLLRDLIDGARQGFGKPNGRKIHIVQRNTLDQVAQYNVVRDGGLTQRPDPDASQIASRGPERWRSER